MRKRRPRRPPSDRLSTAVESAAAGKAARSAARGSSHGEWRAPADRADPTAILERQAASRVPDLAADLAKTTLPAICDFADAYAEQSLRDHEALLGAIESGRVGAEDA